MEAPRKSLHQGREKLRLARLSFLWPLYHNSNELNGEALIEQDFFNSQLELVYELADGVIVWNGPYDHWTRPMSWFVETKQTIERLRNH